MSFWKNDGSKPDGHSQETLADSNSKGESNGSGLTGPEEKLLERFGRVRAALGVGTAIQGRLSFDTVVRIDGKLAGEVFSFRPIIVGKNGQIEADIEAACLIVLGKVRGNVKATEKLEVWAGGLLEGDVVTPSLSVEEGGFFSGSCSMPARQGG